MTAVRQACDAALAAFDPLTADPAARAALLDALAAALAASREPILALCVDESALTAAELAPELARMTGTLRLFAGVVREGSWVRAAIDPASPNAVGPGHDVRRMLVPLGPVAVFGASNFPLAYGVCGGDTASALAAGCPVIVKEHPAHPLTGRLISMVARSAAEKAGFPSGVLGYIENPDPADTAPARELVSHPAVRACGFTGSPRGGLAVERLGRERPCPIPVFAEMGSINPVAITQRAAAERTRTIAEALADSILLRFGQQCTCPGLVIVPRIEGPVADLISHLARRLSDAPGRDMLAPWVRDGYLRRVEACAGAPGVRVLTRGHAAPGPRGAGTALLQTDLPTLRAHATLQEEVFGPAAIIVENVGGDPLDDDFLSALTFTVHAGADDPDAARLLQSAARHAGRVIFNGVPTGVRAAAGMVHGGPFPSSNRPDTTAVGPFALERWCRPVCWQNCPQNLLPQALQVAWNG
jgi:2,5-dioxopentanoate dehydrogenase